MNLSLSFHRASRWAFIVLSPVLVVSAHARPLLPSIFGSGMVLQRDAPIPIWGEARPLERVTVALGASQVEVVAGADGRWSAVLPAQVGSAAGATLVVSDSEGSTRFEDVLVGEVWLCSGQSNMAFRVDQCDNARIEIAEARHPLLRLFTVPRRASEEPQKDCDGTWTTCSPETVGAFSGVAYFFGRDLLLESGVPVGLIHSSWGGSPAEAFTPRAVLEGSAEFQPILGRWAAGRESAADAAREFERDRDELVAKWKSEYTRALTGGFKEPTRPAMRAALDRNMPGGLFNAMILPLAPFGVRGVIWYQGEANAGRAEQYRELFPAMIDAWRTAWRREDLPFVYVQLPNLRRQPEPSTSGWAELREAQAMALRLPHTAMAVTIDIGNPLNLHPANKQYVARRLLLAAQGLVYGGAARDCFSPVYESHAIAGDRIRILFRASHGALRTRGQEELCGFVVCGDDRKWRGARATIDGNEVLVWHEEISTPVAVRYAWADDPAANLVGASGLPASPFRTDDWPEVTTGRR